MKGAMHGLRIHSTCSAATCHVPPNMAGGYTVRQGGHAPHCSNVSKPPFWLFYTLHNVQGELDDRHQQHLDQLLCSRGQDSDNDNLCHQQLTPGMPGLVQAGRAKVPLWNDWATGGVAAPALHCKLFLVGKAVSRGHAPRWSHMHTSSASYALEHLCRERTLRPPGAR
jgi:hypothetical protein